MDAFLYVHCHTDDKLVCVNAVMTIRGYKVENDVQNAVKGVTRRVTKVTKLGSYAVMKLVYLLKVNKIDEGCSCLTRTHADIRDEVDIKVTKSITNQQS